MKILVIDDSKEDRDLIITHIKKSRKKEKITTDESNCLEDALKKIKLNNYDVIILDLILPKTDGIETVKKVVEHLKKIKKDVPIIVLTGVEDYKIGREARLLGIKDYLIKDEIQEKDLIRSLSFAVRGNHVRKRFLSSA